MKYLCGDYCRLSDWCKSYFYVPCEDEFCTEYEKFWSTVRNKKDNNIMKDLNLKDIVKDNKVYFSYYRAGYLYYNVKIDDTLYMFPVPIEDVGDASFFKEDKALLFMRYIRKALNDNSFVEVKE